MEKVTPLCVESWEIRETDNSNSREFVNSASLNQWTLLTFIANDDRISHDSTHNQCFGKLSQLTANMQEPTHDHTTHSTYNANRTLPLNDALIVRPHTMGWLLFRL